jgi:hypothetical protein
VRRRTGAPPHGPARRVLRRVPVSPLSVRRPPPSVRSPSGDEPRVPRRGALGSKGQPGWSERSDISVPIDSLPRGWWRFCRWGLRRPRRSHHRLPSPHPQRPLTSRLSMERAPRAGWSSSPRGSTTRTATSMREPARPRTCGSSFTRAAPTTSIALGTAPISTARPGTTACVRSRTRRRSPGRTSSVR